MICRLCGRDAQGQPFDRWVKDTFTNWDILLPGAIICNDCLFWFGQKSSELQTLLGKDKPQKMQNYSHFIKEGEWIPLSKGDKVRMRETLLSPPFPELAAIANSGQRHIVFRATRNEPGQTAGWVQFEEQRLYVVPDELSALLDTVETLYTTFAKQEIESGDYAGYRILEFGLPRWSELENKLKPMRGKPLFYLAIFLAQRSDDGSERDDCDVVGADMEGDARRLQEPLPDDHLESVRERDTQRGIHEQGGKVRQLTLFET